MRRVGVRDFQSLRAVTLAVGKFTVISGPSNSGKSALLRAIRTVAENVDSPVAIVRHGAKNAATVLEFDEGKVAIVRGRSRAEYVLGEERYPKSGKAVPAEVEEFLRFAEVEGERLSFAFQFDRPFLLDDPATQVAKVFGDLTNVTVLFAAVREANRRRLDVVQRLKTRTADLENIRARAEAYADVGERAKKVEAVRIAYDQLVIAARAIDLLRVQTRVLKSAEQAIAAIEEVSIPEPVADQLSARYGAEVVRMRSLVEVVWQQDLEIPKLEQEVVRLTELVASYDEAYHRTLTEAGTCPLCGQEVTEEAKVVTGS